MGHNDYDGKIVDALKCPICGSSKVLQKGSGWRVKTEYAFVSPRRYKWVCSDCGANFYSTERRPSGENRCCVHTLSEYRGRQQSKYWTGIGNGVFKRELSATCGVCGEVYVWDETLVLRGG